MTSYIKRALKNGEAPVFDIKAEWKRRFTNTSSGSIGQIEFPVEYYTWLSVIN